MAVDLLITYKAEVDQLTKQLNLIIEKQEQITDEQKAGQAAINKNLTAQQVAAEKRLALLKLEEAELKKLQQLKKLAYDPKVIEDYNKKIAASQKNIELLGGKIKKTTTETGSALKSFASGVASAFGIAFSVQAIVEFGQASVNAFLEADKTAQKLKNTLIAVNGESTDTFDRLIQQSKELQNITIFSDDSIQQAQTALAAFGLTGQQIEELLPKLADFATISNTDIVSAAERVGAGLEGAGREFQKYGILVSATATRFENFNTILNGFTRFQGAANSAADTFAGRLERQKNAIDDLQEEIGEKLLPAFLKIKEFGLRAVETIADLFGTETQSQAEKAAETFTKIAQEFNVSIEVLKRGNLTQEQRKDLITEINTQYQEYLPNLLTEKSSLEEIEKAQAAVNKQLEGRIILVALEEDIVRITKNSAAATKALIQVQKDRVKSEKLLGDNAQVASATRDQLNQREAVANALIQEGRDELAGLQDQYAKLAAQLGINLNANNKLLDAQKKAVKESTERDRSLDFETKKVTELSAKYEDLIKVFTTLDKLKEIGLDVKVLDDPNLLKQQVAELSAKSQAEIKIPVTLDTKKFTTKDFDDGIDAVEDKVKETQELILASSQQLFNDLTSLYNAYSDQRVTDIQSTTNTEIENLDKQLQANEEALQNRRLSEREAANEKIRIEAEKVKAEQEADKKIRAIKRQQAIINKIAALADIAISTAKNVASFPALTAFYLAIGAAQAAIVAAQPIPYKKGSKNTKEGLARVGEEGEEIVFMPGGSKVLPAKQTQTYGSALDAMFDNRFDKWVIDNYAPKLIAQQKQHKESESKSYAKNIADSLTVNVASAPMNRRKDRVTMDNIEELAEAIVRSSFQSPYRR